MVYSRELAKVGRGEQDKEYGFYNCDDGRHCPGLDGVENEFPDYSIGLLPWSFSAVLIELPAEK